MDAFEGQVRAAEQTLAGAGVTSVRLHTGVYGDLFVVCRHTGDSRSEAEETFSDLVRASEFEILKWTPIHRSIETQMLMLCVDAAQRLLSGEATET